MPTKLIAFSGKKGAGKDWCAGYLTLKKMKKDGRICGFNFDKSGQFSIRSWHDFQWKPFFFDYKDPVVKTYLKEIEHAAKRFSSADLVKDQLVQLFDLDRRKLSGSPDCKEEKCGLFWDKIPHYKGQLRGQGEMTYRETMQAWAELVRQLDNRAWIRANCDRILTHFSSYKDCMAINTDTRYKNEVHYLREWSKKNNIPVTIVRLTRKTRDDKHISEVDLDDYNGFDLVIDNANMTFAEVTKELDTLL